MEAGGSCGFAAVAVLSPNLFSADSPLIGDPLCGKAMWETGRWIAAVFLALCLFLPLSSCSTTVAPEGREATAEEPAKVVKVAIYPVEELSDAPAALPFLWPIILLLVRRRVSSGKTQKWLWRCEPVSYLIALGLIIWLSAPPFSHPEIGLWLAALSIVTLFAIWIGEAISAHRARSLAA